MQPRWRCSQVDRRDSLRSRCHDPSGGGGEGRAGKTLLLRQLFPKASYFLLEDPEVVARPGGARLWFSSYLQTYLERNVRAVTAVKDLALFRRFLALLASRRGQVLNKTDLAAAHAVRAHWEQIARPSAVGERSKALAAEQAFVGSDQRQFVDVCRRRQEAVGRILVLEAHRTDCTTNVLMHTRVNPGNHRYSWKILLSGYAPLYTYELGRLDTSLPFDELKRRSHINEAARAANDAQDFSQRIRVNVPAPVAPGRGRRPGE